MARTVNVNVYGTWVGGVVNSGNNWRNNNIMLTLKCNANDVMMIIMNQILDKLDVRVMC